MPVLTLRPSKWPIPGPIFVLSPRFPPGLSQGGENYLHWPIWLPKLLQLFFRRLLILCPAHARVHQAGVHHPSFLPLPSRLHHAAWIPLPYPILPSLYWPFLRADSPRPLVYPTSAHTAPTPTVSMLPPLLGGVGLVSGLLVLKGGISSLSSPFGASSSSSWGASYSLPSWGDFSSNSWGASYSRPLWGDSSFSSWGAFYSRPPSPWVGLLFVSVY
jgi:hypothetical protein